MYGLDILPRNTGKEEKTSFRTKEVMMYQDREADGQRGKMMKI